MSNNKAILYARVVIPVVLFIVAAVGVFGSQIKYEKDFALRYYLYKATARVDGNTETVYFADRAAVVLQCSSVYFVVTSAFSVGIAGWLLTLAGVGIASLSLLGVVGPIIKRCALLLCWMAFVAFTLCVLATIVFYQATFCDMFSLSDMNIDYGFFVLISSAALSLGWALFESCVGVRVFTGRSADYVAV